MKKQSLTGIALSASDFENGITALKSFLADSDENTHLRNGADNNRLDAEFSVYKVQEKPATFITNLLDQIDIDNSNKHLTTEELVLLFKVVPERWIKTYITDDTFRSVIPSEKWPDFKDEKWVEEQSNRYQASASYEKKLWRHYHSILASYGIEDSAEGIKITTKDLPVTDKHISKVKNILRILRDALKSDVRSGNKIDDKRARYYEDKFSEIGRLLAPKEHSGQGPQFAFIKK